MLKGPLNFLYVVCAASDINVGVLGVLHGQSIARAVIVAFPTTLALQEVLSALSDRYADVFVVKLRAVELQEVDKVLAQVDIVGATPAVLALQVACHHHGEQKGTDAPVVGLVELARLEEALEDEEHGPELWVLFEQLLDQFDAIDAILAVEANVDIYGRLFVLQLDDWHFSVLDGLDRSANVRSDQL